MSIERKEKVRLIMHLPEGYSKVLVESTVGLGLAGGGIDLDIPTDAIPPHLRSIGSRFIVLVSSVADAREASEMTAEQIRAANKISVQEIDE